MLDRHRIGWAVTGWAAAEHLAPLATAVPAPQVYVEERALRGPLTLAMRDSPVAEVDSGGRIEFRSADQHLLGLAVRRDGLSLASAPRVFADLQALGGRGDEAAMHLREEVILRNPRPDRSRTTSAEMDAWDRRCRKRLSVAYRRNVTSRRSRRSIAIFDGFAVEREFLCDLDTGPEGIVAIPGARVLRANNLRGTGCVAADWTVRALIANLPGLELTTVWVRFAAESARVYPSTPEQKNRALAVAAVGEFIEALLAGG